MTVSRVSHQCMIKYIVSNGLIVKWLRHRPFTAGSRVRIPLRSPLLPGSQAVRHTTLTRAFPSSNLGRATIYLWRGGEIGRRKGLKIPRAVMFVSVQVRPSLPFIGKWLNLAEHLVWDQGVAGSNPVFPTIFIRKDDEYGNRQKKLLCYYANDHLGWNRW